MSRQFRPDLINVSPVSEIPNRSYRMFALDMTQERKYQELEFDGLYHELAVFGDATTDVNIYLNEKQNDKIVVVRGTSIEITNFVINKIYVTNDAGAGTTYIWIASKYKDDIVGRRI